MILWLVPVKRPSMQYKTQILAILLVVSTVRTVGLHLKIATYFVGSKSGEQIEKKKKKVHHLTNSQCIWYVTV